MCGLFGARLNQPDSRMVPLVAVLAVTMDCRGGHSYGYWADGTLHKGLGTFTNSNQARNFGGVTTLMAHTRLASVGAKTVENSHPFQMGHIVGAHNGGIYNYPELNRIYNRKFEVDSMHIFEHIDKYQFDRLSELHGYGAVTWLDDREPELINFAKWNSGALAIADVQTKNGKPLGTVWASTIDALAPALEISGFKFTNYKVDEKKLYYTRGEKLVVANDIKLEFNERSWTNTSYKEPVGKKPIDVKPMGYWDGAGSFHTFSENPTINKKDTKTAEKTIYVPDLSPENAKKLEAAGFEIHSNGGGYRVTRNKPVNRGNEKVIDFPTNVETQRRKCFSCDTTNVNTSRHPELGAPMCFYCTMMIEGALQVGNPGIDDVDELTRQFEAKIAEEDQTVPAAFKEFLEKGTGDTIDLPTDDTITPWMI